VYSNRLNLPEPLVRAAIKARAMYSKGPGVRFSVTELIGPAREGALQRKYGDLIVEDISDILTSLYGTLMHKIIEDGGAPETKAHLEERLFAEVDGIKISGAMDHTLFYPNGCIEDWKFTSAYNVMGPPKEEWVAQLNMYKWLREMQGNTITELRIVALLRDWSIAKARQAGHDWTYNVREDGVIDVFSAPDPAAPNEQAERRYPSHGEKTLNIPLWSCEDTLTYIKERIQLHIIADEWADAISSGKVYDGLEPICTDEERWTKPVKYAHMKHTRKSAVHLYDSENEAYLVANSAPGSYVEKRGGERTKCLDWCVVGRAGLCTQWNNDRPTGEVKTAQLENVYE